MAESAMPVIGDYFNLQTIKEETKQLPEKNKFALEAQKGKTLNSKINCQQCTLLQ